jgi:RNA polymerase sigma factor (TIGR02999 family)
MNEASQLLSAIEQGDPQAASQLFPLVYDELRRMAAQKLAQEPAGQTLQPTALVHEAYLRLVGDGEYRWDSRGHFFAACAEAMRRILIDNARRRLAQKRGGAAQRLPLDDLLAAADRQDDELLALDEALDELEKHDAQAAQLVKLRHFSGLSHQDAAEVLGITRRVADRLWAVAKAWLHRRLHEG